jgi:16S rRNA (guanine966-N2)-methyltransferase
MRQVLALDVPAPVTGLGDAKAIGFYQEATRRITELDGVQGVAVGSFVPWRDAGTFGPGFQFTVEGNTPANEAESPHARMRIVAGKWKGRHLTPPAGRTVRPTADRVREAWMSIVQLDIPDARVLDLFAGSGALGLEALSRGARSADFVDDSAQSLKILQSNLVALDAGVDAVSHRADAIKFIAKLDASEYDVAFADPPYGKGLAEAVVEQCLKTPFARVLGVEHERKLALPGSDDRRVYGDTVVTFYRTP